MKKYFSLTLFFLLLFCFSNLAYAFFGTYRDEGKYRIWTFKFNEKESTKMAQSKRNCGPYAAGIINEINDLSEKEWGIKIGSLAAKTILTFKLNSFAKDFRGHPFSIELRVLRDKKLKKILEYLDQAAGIWRKLTSG